MKVEFRTDRKSIIFYTFQFSTIRIRNKYIYIFFKFKRLLSFILYLCLKLLKHKEMAYDFSISGSTLVVTLDTESGKFAESITVYSQPNLVLGNDRIFLKQEGLFLQEFTFENIGDINGDTATNLISAYELLDSLIKSIFVTTAQVDSRIYKGFTVLLSQTGTSAPTAIVLENGIGTVSYSYTGVGLYKINTPTFNVNKIAVFATNSRSDSTKSIVGMLPTASYVEVSTALNGVATNGVLSNTTVEIRVYN